jgi:hypothetical protein
MLMAGGMMKEVQESTAEGATEAVTLTTSVTYSHSSGCITTSSSVS